MNESPFCNVAVPGVRDRLLTYRPPSGLPAEAVVGRRVLVPLGRGEAVGVAVEATGETPRGTLRTIREVLDARPVVPEELLRLTRWIADYYLCDWARALRTALPAGLLAAPEWRVVWTGPELEGMWPAEVQGDRALVKLARLAAGYGQVPFKRLQRAGSAGRLRERLLRLESFGLLRLEELPPADTETVFTKLVVRLAEGGEQEPLPEGQAARRRLLALLEASGGAADWSSLRGEARVGRGVLDALVRMGRVVVERVPRGVDAAGFDPRAEAVPPPLTAEQAAAVRQVMEALEAGGYAAFLLTGPPGGGKTRVYLEAVREASRRGRGALILVPEIALTPQALARIRAAVGGEVAVLHSSLTEAQRLSAWREVLAGRTRVAVGPRSAVFAPLDSLGLIVVDEEHEESYKQQESAPRYNARDVALVRGRMTGAAVLLVSATPSLESVRLAEEGRATRLRLVHRFGAGWPVVTVVDRRREGPDAPYIGEVLAKKIEERAGRGEGIVLMITRRGYAPVLVCRECGERVSCPHCSLSLTLHRQGREPRLRCHLCGYSRRVPDRCPACGSIELAALGAGTQRIEEEIARRFPDLHPVRMDRDTTRGGEAHELILRRFASGEAGALLGTQMVAKGHDFAHVTLVGVINADPSLFLPDFRAAERTFRLLVQAAGRAGRGEKPGEIVVQSLDPENPVFTALAGPDVEGFLAREAAVRRENLYPPFARMALVTFASADEEEAAAGAEAFAARLRRLGPPLVVDGPAEAQVKRVKRRWRRRIAVRTPRSVDPSGARLREALRSTMAGLVFSSRVSLMVDVDPVEVT